MKRITVVLVLTMLAAPVALLVAAPSVPQTLNLQGRFTDVAGNNVADGVHTVVFSIYDDPVAGNILWSETLPVQVTDGLFTVLVGDSAEIPEDIFAGANRYLGVTVNSEPEMPRIPLSSVAYAYQTQDAREATLAYDLTCVACVTVGEIGANAVRSAEIAAGAVIGGLGGDILDESVTADDLDTNSVGSDEIAAGAVIGGLGGAIFDGRVTADDLGTNSVGSDEIAADAVGDSEIIAGAVRSSEVLDGSLTAVDIADEPGVASNGTVLPFVMNGTIQTLLTRTIFAPAAGYVLAIATVELTFSHTNGTPSYGIFGVSSTAGDFPTNQAVQVRMTDNAPTGTYRQAVTLHGLFSTPGGAGDFYLVGFEISGDLTGDMLQLTLIYFPTAYGTVVATAAASGGEELSSQSPETDPILFGPDSEPIQQASADQPVSKQELALMMTEMKAEMEARIQQLEASFRGGLPEIEQKR